VPQNPGISSTSRGTELSQLTPTCAWLRFLGVSEGYGSGTGLPRPRIAALAIAPQLQQIRPLAVAAIAA